MDEQIGRLSQKLRQLDTACLRSRDGADYRY